MLEPWEKTLFNSVVIGFNVAVWYFVYGAWVKYGASE
jgi:hypothetical protein